MTEILVDSWKAKSVVSGYINKNIKSECVPNDVILLIYTFYDSNMVTFMLFDKNGELNNNCESFKMTINKNITFKSLHNYVCKRLYIFILKKYNE